MKEIFLECPDCKSTNLETDINDSSFISCLNCKTSKKSRKFIVHKPKNISLKETCINCGEHITLQFVYGREKKDIVGEIQLIKTCLDCGHYPITKIGVLCNEADLAKEQEGQH